MKAISKFLLLVFLLFPFQATAQLGPQGGSAAPSGSATGDLSGTYPAPTVAKINGSTPAAIATSGSASDLGTGTIAAGRMPALTGDCTTSAGAVATVCTKTNGTNFAPSATTDTTQAGNISGGTLNQARLPTGLSGVLGSLRSANFTITTDQAIPINSRITAFQITKITVTNCSGTLTLAVGGFYPTTSKGGTPIVAASQAYSALSALTIVLNPTIASNPRMTLTNVYLALSTGAGSAAACDVYVIGDDLT